MALNFPDPATQTPVNTFSPTSTPDASTNGITYLWDGQKWNAQTNGDAAFWQRVGTTLSPATVGDNISTTGDLTTADATVNTLTSSGDVQVGSLNSGPLSGFRNQLINGNFRVWQRGTTGGGSYVADRWRLSGGAGNTYNRLVNDTDLEALGLSFGLTNNGPGATIFGQYIELTRNGRACQFPVGSQWTWTVWSTASPGTTLINWSEDDNTTTEVASTPGDWTEIATQGSWTRYQQTFTIANAPADTGINSLLVRFNIASGESVAGCQLERGPVATPLEIRPFQTELALCMRYYQTLDRMQLFAPNSNATNKVLSVPRTVTMRANPTENGTASNGTLSLTGTALNYQVEADSVAQSVASFLSNYTADAEL